jgi:hypothetical protein
MLALNAENKLSFNAWNECRSHNQRVKLEAVALRGDERGDLRKVVDFHDR